MPVEIINKWKEALVALVGLLVVVLQIINVFLSNDIDHSLGAKATQLQEKQNALEQLLKRQTEVLQANGDVSRGNSKVVTDTNAVVHEMDKEVTSVGQQLTQHIEASKRFLERVSASPTPSHTHE